MMWLWFLAGAIFGLALGMMVTCAIVINRELDELEKWYGGTVIIFKCGKCKAYLGKIEDMNKIELKAKRGAVIENNSLILKCKCGEITKIDMTAFLKQEDKINEWYSCKNKKC